MPRRIEVELTSAREDGTWTWRAAGARQPKGTLDGSLLYEGAAVGDVVRADADFDVDGITVTAVLPPKSARQEPERLELLGRPLGDDQLVTSTLAPKRRGDRGDRRGRRRDDEGGRGERPRRDRDRQDRGPRAGGEGRPRTERRPRPEPPAPKPKPKRLRPGRTHRNAVLDSLPEEERPIAEQVLRGGIPAVRQAVDKQNEQARADGLPEVKADPLVAIAERLLPRLRAAEWRDRADAALAVIDELDLRDLRSVVVAADTGARDDEAREVAAQLREGLSRRVESEHSAWLAEMSDTLREGRVVRALRLSSRPPKAGAPLPPELATSLAAAAGEALAADVTQERWTTVLDAIAYSPVRQQVTPAAVPAEPGDALLAAVRKLASRTPQIATLFGVEPTDRPARKRGGSRGGANRPVPPPPAAEAPAQETPAEATPAQETPAQETPPQETPVQDVPAEGGEEPTAEAVDAPEAAPAEASAVAADVADAIEAAAEPEAASEPEGTSEPEAASEPEPATDEDQPSS